MSDYILHHEQCEICVWSEKGFYNPMCCHCQYVTFGKSEKPKFMTRGMAEYLGLAQNKENEDGA